MVKNADKWLEQRNQSTRLKLVRILQEYREVINSTDYLCTDLICLTRKWEQQLTVLKKGSQLSKTDLPKAKEVMKHFCSDVLKETIPLDRINQVINKYNALIENVKDARTSLEKDEKDARQKRNGFTFLIIGSAIVLTASILVTLVSCGVAAPFCMGACVSAAAHSTELVGAASGLFCGLVGVTFTSIFISKAKHESKELKKFEDAAAQSKSVLENLEKHLNDFVVPDKTLSKLKNHLKIRTVTSDGVVLLYDLEEFDEMEMEIEEELKKTTEIRKLTEKIKIKVEEDQAKFFLDLEGVIFKLSQKNV